MKNILLTLFAALALSMPAFAQEKQEQFTQETDSNELLTEDENTLVVNSFIKNWEITAGIGTQSYLAEYSHTHFLFKDWWCFPGVDLSIQKWASPFFGLGVGLNFSPYKGLYATKDTWNIYSTPDDPIYRDDLYGNTFHMAKGYYLNIFAKGYFSLTNLIGGYRPNRIYHLNGYVGGGVIFPVGPVTYRSNTATFNAGLINQFRITPKLSIDLAIRGALIGDNFNGISYFTSRDHDNIPMDGQIGITAGVSYKFGFVNKKNLLNGEETEVEWVPMATAVYSTTAYSSAMKLAKQVQQKAKEDQKIAEEKIAAQQEKIQEKEAELAVAVAAVKVRNVNYKQYVNFPIDRWVVSNREKVSIMLAAEVMKALPDTKFLIQGFADMQTSYPEHNYFLSQHRADVVREILVREFGVDPKQLEVKYNGGVDFMYFEDPQCSRSVLITVIE